jgi:hypothetical protein
MVSHRGAGWHNAKAYGHACDGIYLRDVASAMRSATECCLTGKGPVRHRINKRWGGACWYAWHVGEARVGMRGAAVDGTSDLGLLLEVRPQSFGGSRPEVPFVIASAVARRCPAPRRGDVSGPTSRVRSAHSGRLGEVSDEVIVCLSVADSRCGVFQCP